MKQKIGKALDHLIYIHKIEDRKNTGVECARMVGVAVLVLGWLFVADVLLQGSGSTVAVNATVAGIEVPICSVATDNQVIALTFDVAWNNENIEKITEVLREQGVKATFFVTGEWVTAYPESAKAILASGHDLGNHSNTHPSMSMLSDTEKKEEILEVHEKVKELTGYEMELFRPPHGDYENGVINAAKNCGYYPILWNVNSLDWKDYGADNIVEEVVENPDLRPGSIILCHNSGLYTAEALEEMIIKLQEKGYTFLPVSELIYRENYYIDVSGTQRVTGVIETQY